MNKILCAVSLLSCLATTQALAAPITVEYQAKVDWLIVSRYDLGLSEPVTYPDSDSTAGFSISKGESITGYFSYDPEMPLERGGYSPVDFYDYLRGNFSQSLKFASHQSLITVDTDNYLLTGYYKEPYTITAYNGQSPDGWEIRGYFNQTGPDVITRGFLLAADQWDSFAHNSKVHALWMSPDTNRNVWISASIGSFRVVTAVPEPSTYLMLGAGLGLIALAYRNRRAVSKARGS